MPDSGSSGSGVPRRGRVIAARESDYPNPVRFAAGEEMVVTDKETDWPGWLWCTTRAGISGWAPAAYVRREGGTAVALRDYDATELNVRVGDELTIVLEEGGWYLCRTTTGEQGWVPSENLELV